jgi:hypothetical protein
VKTTAKEWLLSLLASIAVLAAVWNDAVETRFEAEKKAGLYETKVEPSSKTVGALASSAKDGGER